MRVSCGSAAIASSIRNVARRPGMARYVEAFHPSMVGLTGTPEQIAEGST
jgi:hypothetical protein